MDGADRQTASRRSIFGAGSQTMDFIYVEDIARANILAATCDATDDVFNIASGVETSLAELADKLLAVMGSNLSVEFGPERAVNKVSRRLADISQARDVLGFEAQVNIEQGLAGLVEWWRAECENSTSAALAATS